MQVKLNGHTGESLRVCAGNAPLQQVSCVRLLGFHLDNALTWEKHINEVCGRLGRACFALRRLARTAGRAAVRDCYFATVHSVLTYGVELWARAADWYRVFSMQKRAVRGMAGKPADAPARELFLEFQILPLPCILIYQVAIFTHENLGQFKCRGTNSRYPLRSNKHGDRLVAEQHRLTKSGKSVYSLGPSIYNRLPDTIRNAASTAGFKSRMKKWLLKKMFYDYSEFFNLPLIM